MKRVCEFLENAGVYYLATVEGDQPRVRPFGTAHIFEDKLYIQTGKYTHETAQHVANARLMAGVLVGVLVQVANQKREQQIERDDEEGVGPGDAYFQRKQLEQHKGDGSDNIGGDQNQIR